MFRFAIAIFCVLFFFNDFTGFFATKVGYKTWLAAIRPAFVNFSKQIAVAFQRSRDVQVPARSRPGASDGSGRRKLLCL